MISNNQLNGYCIMSFIFYLNQFAQQNLQVSINFYSSLLLDEFSKYLSILETLIT